MHKIGQCNSTVQLRVCLPKFNIWKYCIFKQCKQDLTQKAEDLLYQKALALTGVNQPGLLFSQVQQAYA